METKTGNFIEQMKKRLNAYQIQKVKKIEEKQGYQELFKQQNQAKAVLIQIGDVSEIVDENQLSGYEEITGWMNRKPKKCKEDATPSLHKEMLSGSRKNALQSAPSRSLGVTDNYMGRNRDPRLLVRLQSPQCKKRQLQTQVKNRNDPQTNKLKTQETLLQLKKSKQVLQTQVQFEEKGGMVENSQNKLRMTQKPERAKFQTLDLGSENRPMVQSARKSNGDYQKIRRKSQNQYEIDIAHEKDILQQLIKGTSNQKNNQNYFSTKVKKTSDRFTLKNLLC